MKLSDQLVNQIDYCNYTLTSAGKGIIDGSGHFSFLNAVIPERFFKMSCKEEKNTHLSVFRSSQEANFKKVIF